jgi:hypothetical protein
MSKKPHHNPPVCPRCTDTDKRIESLLHHLDCKHLAKGGLVMWPGTDMRWYAVTCEISSLLNCEKEIARVRAALLKCGIRPGDDIVSAIERLNELRYENQSPCTLK